MIYSMPVVIFPDVMCDRLHGPEMIYPMHDDRFLLTISIIILYILKNSN